MCWISEKIAPAPAWALSKSLENYFAGWETSGEPLQTITDEELGLLLPELTATQDIGCQTPAAWDLADEPTKAERGRAEPRNRTLDPGMIPPLTGNRTACTL